VSAKGDTENSVVTFRRAIRLLGKVMLLSLLLFAAPASGLPLIQDESPVTATPQARAIAYLLQRQLPDGSWRLPGNDRFSLAGAACGGLALVQAGLPAEHRAVVLVDELLAHHPPMLVYDAAVRVQFLDATQPENRASRLERAAAVLLAPQNGYFNYGQPGQDLAGDLSNHQFALIGLELLDRYELGPSKKHWEKLAKQLLSTQLEDHSWGYFAGSDSSPTMRLAGVACLGACWQALTRHRANSRLLAEIERAIENALLEVDRNWILDQPRKRAPLNRWIHYGLATLERAMALSPQQQLATRDWYADSRKFLEATQRTDGSWASPRGEATVNTMLALLTLSRATASTSEGPADENRSIWVRRWLSKPGELQIVASGQAPCTAFVNLELSDGEELVETRWDLEGTSIGESRKPRGAIQFDLQQNGELQLQATCQISHPAGGGLREIAAKLVVQPSGIIAQSDQAAFERLRATVPSTLRGFSAKASSAVGGVRGPQWAFDGTHAAAWRWKATDSEPWIEASWDTPPRCRGLRLLPLRTSTQPSNQSQAVRFRIFVNGKSKLWTFPEGLDEQGQLISFPSRRKVRELRIEVLPYTSKEPIPLRGFSEIELITHGPS